MQICYLPKIGDSRLALGKEYYNGKWGFSKRVATFMKKKGINECWFQTFSNGEWDWFHGIVILENDKAIITQIG